MIDILYLFSLSVSHWPTVTVRGKSWNQEKRESSLDTDYLNCLPIDIKPLGSYRILLIWDMANFALDFLQTFQDMILEGRKKIAGERCGVVYAERL